MYILYIRFTIARSCAKIAAGRIVQSPTRWAPAPGITAPLAPRPATLPTTYTYSCEHALNYFHIRTRKGRYYYYLGKYTTPLSLSLSISSLFKDKTVESISLVCCPNRGDGLSTLIGVFENLIGNPVVE